MSPSVPEPRAWMFHYRVSELMPLISWPHFLHAWKLPSRLVPSPHVRSCDGCRGAWLQGLDDQDRIKAREALRIMDEAQAMLLELDHRGLTVHCALRLMEAVSCGDDLLLEGRRLPMLRQQRPDEQTGCCLCLADFIRPMDSGPADTAGVFACSADDGPLRPQIRDPYGLLLMETLFDRLVEAGAERLHQAARRELWGYAPDERLGAEELLRGTYQGIRPAVGYPCLPDQSLIFLLDELLDFRRIGITLTENGAMHPHASVSGLMLAHPQSRYFSVGPILEDQLMDYSLRRGLSMDRLREFLASNLQDAP